MWALLAVALTAAPPGLVVAVVDTSASDAIYEDVSRALAEGLVTAMKREGFSATRVDENELPQEGCRAGPCLEKVARSTHADVVVVLDAAEESGTTRVSVMALWGRDGRPLAAKRYQVGKRDKKAVAAFLAQLEKAIPARPDAGSH